MTVTHFPPLRRCAETGQPPFRVRDTDQGGAAGAADGAAFPDGRAAPAAGVALPVDGAAAPVGRTGAFAVGDAPRDARAAKGFSSGRRPLSERSVRFFELMPGPSSGAWYAPEHGNERGVEPMRVLILFNERAGRKKGEGFGDALLEAVKGRCAEVEMRSPSRKGEMIELARAARDEGWDRVLAAGGDGTLNEVSTGLAGSETPMAVVPLGTVNVFARDMGIPLDWEAAVEKALTGEARAITLGRVGPPGQEPERFFIFCCGVGLDGHVLRQENLKLKALVGEAAYYWMAVKGSLSFPAHPFTVEIPEADPIEAVMAVVGNTPTYGGKYRITPEADPFDDFVDLCLLKRYSTTAVARFMFGAWRGGKHLDMDEVEYLKIRRCILRPKGKKSVWTQVDGELHEALPMEIRAEPRALRVIL